ncbi:ABC transporter ATP-binding protein [Halobacteriales archaeon QH_10_70_21]|nr:MAG: ABC transporter ATP-binding protein [Halobacteriales archaeon QH_10_70_21]
MSTRETILEVENLKTQFFTEEGVVRAVDGISFDVRRGEIVGLVGESGAGKSVAVQSLMRLVEEPGAIVGGEIRFKDKLLFGLEEEEATGPDERTEREEMLTASEMRTQIRGRAIAIIFQDPMESLNPVYTVGSQIEEFIGLNRGVTGTEAREIAVETLRDVGIPEVEQRYDDYPHQFSGGMRQRVLIAMALACEPDLIIADEPTTALDVTVEAQILNLVDDLQAEYDTSFVWVTHDMGVVAEICDRVNVMYLGEIVEQAPVDDLFHDTKHPYTDALLGSLPRPDRTVEELESIGGVMPEAINPPSGCRFHPRCPEAREVCAEVHPDTRESAASGDHRVACFRDDAFDVGYDESPPLESETGGGFEATLTSGEGDDR